jgi:hypothetical protein
MTDTMIVDPTGLLSLPFSSRRALPTCTATYVALSGSGDVLYVGKAIRLQWRWRDHHRAYQLACPGCARLSWLECDRGGLRRLERRFSTYFHSPLNGALSKCVQIKAKAPYLRKTLRGECEQVLLAFSGDERGGDRPQAYIASQKGV